MNNINEFEIKESTSSEKEFFFLKNDMRRFRTNSLSYKLGFLGIAFSILGAFILLNSANTSFYTILKIAMNILILLFGFLSCEKVKNYSKQGAITLIFFGVACILRCFWYPLWLIKYQILYNTHIKENMEEAQKYLGKIITGTFDLNYLPTDGIGRGIAAIVCLLIAAAAFICSGVYGLILAKRLESHMSENNIKV